MNQVRTVALFYVAALMVNISGSLRAQDVVSAKVENTKQIRDESLLQLRANHKMSKQIIHTKKAPAAIGPYSQAVIANNTLIFTAGQIAINPETGQVIDADIKTQTRRVMENLKAILEEAGTSFASVVKTTVFIKDMSEFAAMNEVYGEYFKENPPARSTVEVARLPRDVRVEIEAIAILETK